MRLFARKTGSAGGISRITQWTSAAALLSAAAIPWADTLAPDPAPLGNVPAGRIVFKDPETGQLRAPTSDEYQMMFGAAGPESAEKSDAMPPEEVRPDGSRRLRVRDHLRAAVHATVDHTGAADIDCGGHPSSSNRGDVR